MEYVCCFTGHRKIEPRHEQCIVDILDRTLEKLISSGVTVFRVGGAMGFDTIAALKVLEKKRIYSHIKLQLCLPCKNQTERWNDYEKKVYEYVMEYADSISYAAEKYHKGCMMARNRQLVEGSDFCVSYCGSQEGGTAYTVNYAESQNVKIINVFKLCEEAVK